MIWTLNVKRSKESLFHNNLNPEAKSGCIYSFSNIMSDVELINFLVHYPPNEVSPAGKLSKTLRLASRCKTQKDRCEPLWGQKRLGTEPRAVLKESGGKSTKVCFKMAHPKLMDSVYTHIQGEKWMRCFCICVFRPAGIVRFRGRSMGHPEDTKLTIKGFAAKAPVKTFRIVFFFRCQHASINFTFATIIIIMINTRNFMDCS